MYCSACGKQIPDDSGFCNQCGALQKSGHVQPAVFGNAEHDVHCYTIDKRTKLVITTKRVIYDVGGFLGVHAEIPLQHITDVERLGNVVRINRADGRRVKFNFGGYAEEIAQSIRDAVAGF